MIICLKNLDLIDYIYYKSTVKQCPYCTLEYFDIITEYWDEYTHIYFKCKHPCEKKETCPILKAYHDLVTILFVTGNIEMEYVLRNILDGNIELFDGVGKRLAAL